MQHHVFIVNNILTSVAVLIGLNIGTRWINSTLPMPTGGASLDVGYWESLLSQLKAYLARARLRDRHKELLRSKLYKLKQEQLGDDAAQPSIPRLPQVSYRGSSCCGMEFFRNCNFSSCKVFCSCNVKTKSQCSVLTEMSYH